VSEIALAPSSAADAQLRTRVAISLALQSRESFADVRPSVADGIVTLRGTVPYSRDRERAGDMCRRVAGILGVRNELEVAALRSSLPPVASCRLATAGLALLLITLLVGCSRKSEDRVEVHPVQGQVTFQGKPLPQAFVVLHPKNASDPRAIAARGQTDAAGNFRLTTYDADDGAAVGEYAVTVQCYRAVDKGGGLEPGPNILPPKFATPTSTDIVVRVAEGTNTLPPISIR
jgi:hypothetical protein